MFGSHGKVVCPHHPTPGQCDAYKKFWKEYYTFTCVRNPFDRIVSWYAFFRKRYSQGKLSRSAKICQKHSFKDFVFNCLGTESVETKCGGEGIRPLVNWFPAEIRNHPGKWTCHEEPYQYDQVLRFENITDDIKSLQGRFGLGALPRINCSKRNAYQEFYDDETIKKVEQYYKDDLNKFGYKYDK